METERVRSYASITSGVGFHLAWSTLFSNYHLTTNICVAFSVSSTFVLISFVVHRNIISQILL